MAFRAHTFFSRLATGALAVNLAVSCMAGPVAVLGPNTPGALAEAETAFYNRVIDVPGIGAFPYYAQNDPRWARALYEPANSEYRRTMAVGGCGPSAAAIAIARQLSPEEIAGIAEYARNPEKGFQFCSCAVNNYYHSGREDGHERYTARTVEDFTTYLPVIFANYATGNNTWRRTLRTENGTQVLLFELLAADYGLEYKAIRDWEDALPELEAGASLITTVTEGPFTESSHFLCVAGVSNGFIYLLDPMMREKYELDKQHLLEVVEPGLVRARMSDFKRLELHGFYMLKRPDYDTTSDAVSR